MLQHDHFTVYSNTTCSLVKQHANFTTSTVTSDSHEYHQKCQYRRQEDDQAPRPVDSGSQSHDLATGIAADPLGSRTSATCARADLSKGERSSCLSHCSIPSTSQVTKSYTLSKGRDNFLRFIEHSPSVRIGTSSEALELLPFYRGVS